MPKPKPRRLKLPRRARTVSVQKHRAALATAIHSFLILKASAIATTAAALYEKAQKADEDKIKRILADLGLDDWGALSDVVQSALIAVYTEGGDAALKALDLGEPALFDRLNEEALAYAKDRGAELVGMKYVDGELVTNPRADWAINESTRDGLRDLISRAFDEGLSPTQLSDAIQESYLFSSARADAISRTELAMAHSAGELEAMRASGVVSGKEWLLGDNHEIEDDCDDNDGAGVIGLDEEFPSGDDGPPAHVNCACALSYQLAEEEAAA